MLIRHDPETGQCPARPSAVHTVAMGGAAALVMAPPSPACHFRRCRMAPPFAALRVSTNATLVPSSDNTGEVSTFPVVAPPAVLKFVLYDQSTAGLATPQNGVPLPAYNLLYEILLASPAPRPAQ